MRSPLLVFLVATACGTTLPAEGERPLEAQRQELCAGPTTLEGIDVARWQGAIDWSKVKASGKVFAIAQAGRGTSADPYFTTNWAGMKAAGLIRGAYLRFFPAQSLQVQADTLIQVPLEPGDLPPMIDIEDADGLPVATVAARVAEIVSAVKAGTGRTPLLYTEFYFWRDFVQSTAYGSYPLVLANYYSTCPPPPPGWSKWTFHQYSSTGAVPGIVGNVDLERFNGTFAQLQALTAQATETGTLTGAIYQKGNTADRVVGATVTLNGVTQTTGADGLYTFLMPPGTYTVTATKAGYSTSSVSRTVTAGAIIWGSMNIDVLQSPATLQGTVYALDAARPTDTSHVVAGATVSASGQSATTDLTGAFQLVLPAGSHTVTVTRERYQSASLSKFLVAGATETASVPLTPVGPGDFQAPLLAVTSPEDGAQLETARVTVTGTASDAAGPLATVSFTLNGAAAQALPVLNGSFSVALKLKAGPNVVELSAVDGAGNPTVARSTVTFKAGLRGTVRARGGGPVAGATLALEETPGVPVAGAVSGADGAYQLDVSAAPLSATLVVAKAGFSSRSLPVTVSDEARAVLDVELDAPSVRFLGLTSGQAVDGASLEVHGEVSGFTPASVTVNGEPAQVSGAGFSVTVSLAPGTNVLLADARGAAGESARAELTVVRRDAAKQGGCSAGGMELSGLAAALLGLQVLARRRAAAHPRR